MRNDVRMTVASRCHQPPVRHLPAIVENRVPGKRSHVTIRFLYDQIRGGKIPVAALTAGKGGIDTSLRHPTESELQRRDARMQHDLAARGIEPLHQRFWPGHA